MLRLQPIQPAQASEKITAMYEDIQNVLGLDSVPVFFQYIANYELYLQFMWEKMKINLESEGFQSLTKDMMTFAIQSMIEFPIPVDIQQITNHISVVEQQHIQDTILRLENINIKLMMLTVDLRESMKSIAIETQKLTQYTSHTTEADAFSQGGLYNRRYPEQVEQAKHLLTPLLGSHEMFVSYYPDFFASVAREMERLRTTESYLKKRVALEHHGLVAITKFVEPMGCSYREFRSLTEGKPYVDELLYIITDLFPSQFPHLVLATAFMENSFQHNTALV